MITKRQNKKQKSILPDLAPYARAGKYAALVFTFSGLILTTPQSALACCQCDDTVSNADSTVWEEAGTAFDDKSDEQFKELEEFITHQIWEQSILPVMMLAAEEFTIVALQQAMIIGTFIDATNQLEAQQLLQEMRAKIHKDYQPSEGLCEFGSVVKSIAASERRGEITSVILAKRGLDRGLGNTNTSAMYGGDIEKNNRVQQFKTKFCNEHERNNALQSSCGTLAWSGLTPEQRGQIGKDIDYFSQMNAPWTLKLDFTNTQITDTGATPPIHNEDEENVLALASNLFAHNTFPRQPARNLTNAPGQLLNEPQKAYLDMRAVVAKRSVAQNSYNAIAGMKTEGNTTLGPSSGSPPEPMRSRKYMENIMVELGVPSAEIMKLLGDNPSYYAQMEVLTKKIYQNPDFFVNLYDKPANVERKTVALGAIKLMQKFDMLKSYLREEATFSILLELAVMDLQKEIEDQTKTIGTSSDRSL